MVRNLGTRWRAPSILVLSSLTTMCRAWKTGPAAAVTAADDPPLPSSKQPPRSSYVREVTRWLDSSDVPWREVEMADAFPSSLAHLQPRQQPSGRRILLALGDAVGVVEADEERRGPQQQRQQLLLHLLPTPAELDHRVPPALTRHMTDEACLPLPSGGNATTSTCSGFAGDAGLRAASSPGRRRRVVHLHEDVWRSRGDIVRSRLLMGLGLTRHRGRRIYARKTVSRRINATIAWAFLDDNHLWSATKAKYYYGLFEKEVAEGRRGGMDGRLVAVATFSSRRKVTRDGIPHRSHELLRFCTRRDETVVGGISKLLRAFVVDAGPDDVVTVIDRDWGSGSGWHQLGFDTVRVMPPLVMAVGVEDGRRRHLVGAGIRPHDSGGNVPGRPAPSDGGGDGGSHRRLGLPSRVLEDLSSVGMPTGGADVDAEEAARCLARHGFFPVYDSGVERLLMIVPDSDAASARAWRSSGTKAEDGVPSTTWLWERSRPTYASSYYSDNPGISALLRHSERQQELCADATFPPQEDIPSATAAVPLPSSYSTIRSSCSSFPMDSDEEVASMESWRAAASVATASAPPGQLVHSAPSSLDADATVEVRERGGGWHTVGIVSGGGGGRNVHPPSMTRSATTRRKRRSIYHGVYRVEAGPSANGRLDPCAIGPSDYLRTMASLALSALEMRREKDRRHDFERDASLPPPPPRFLHLGFGAGALPRLLAHHVPGSRHVAVELDGGVVDAARKLDLLRTSSPPATAAVGSDLRIVAGDALAYRRDGTEEDPFDCVFIDVFDGENALPPEFHSSDFLERLRDDVLGPSGIVVHNFHDGNAGLARRLGDAASSYAGAFQGCCRVRSFDSRPTGGNTIVLASKVILGDGDGEDRGGPIGDVLAGPASRAQRRWGLLFDAATRVKPARSFGVL